MRIDSRYGTTIFRFVPEEISAKAEITLPKVDKDRLIFVLSFRRSPVAPVLDARSDPSIEQKQGLNRWSLKDDVTGEIDEIDHTGLLRFPVICFGDLTEMNGHDSVGSTTRCVHVRRRDRSILGSFGNPSFNILIAADWHYTETLGVEWARCRMLTNDKSCGGIRSSFRSRLISRCAKSTSFREILRQQISNLFIVDFHHRESDFETLKRGRELRLAHQTTSSPLAPIGVRWWCVCHHPCFSSRFKDTSSCSSGSSPLMSAGEGRKDIYLLEQRKTKKVRIARTRRRTKTRETLYHHIWNCQPMERIFFWFLVDRRWMEAWHVSTRDLVCQRSTSQ